MALVAKDTYELTKAIISFVELGVKIGKDLILNDKNISEQELGIWNKTQKSRIRTAIKRLERLKIIAWSEKSGEIKLVLTDKGQKKVLQYKLDEMKIRKIPIWDGYFRMVIFDIPETKKGVREIFRKKLKELEFSQLQKSVFVSPYECRDEIEFLRNVYEVGPNVSYVLAREIPDFTFNLPKS